MTEPLTPPDCDLQDFAFMPLDVNRLRDSDLASLETPEACWAAVLLWCASWHQIPAASLPDDDRVLAKLSGFGRVVKEWLRVRDGALRGWIKCTDGRLYHPVVAEKANESWLSKHRYAYDKLCDRTRKENKKREVIQQPLIEFFTFEEWISFGRPDSFNQEFRRKQNTVPAETDLYSVGIPTENALKGQGQGQGQGQGYIKPEETSSQDFNLSVGDENLKNPGDWFSWFNRNHGTNYDPMGLTERKKLMPIFTNWHKAGVTPQQVNQAIKRAFADATEPIVNLAAYVDRVLASQSPPGGKPHDRIQQQRDDIAELTGSSKVFATGTVIDEQGKVVN